MWETVEDVRCLGNRSYRVISHLTGVPVTELGLQTKAVLRHTFPW
ncbi:rCG54506 [Rattus norvegicus]|uniref:RCG54506 n=1 Tax=Rattus norvegicus TaxID=10116 RepID=A6JAG8_RAT|nr:rCG54506 [Rattus norvegicus]